MAAPRPIDDEAFLLFLADSIEQNGELIDPLSMTEQEYKDEFSESPKTSDSKEANHE